MAKRQTLDAWIAECMADPERDGPIAAFVLIHIGPKDTELDRVRFGGARQWAPSELSMRFRGKSESFAQDLPGAQTFNLLAFYYSSPDGTTVRPEPEGLHPFVVVGSSESAGGVGGLVTESPDPKGQTQQGMRHVEVIFKENLNFMRSMIDRMADMNTVLARQNTEQQRELIETTKVVRELYLQSRAEEHRIELERGKDARQTELLQAAVKLVPSLINTVTGKDVFPQSVGDTALIESIAARLTPEMVAGLAGILPPDVMGLLAQRFESTLTERVQAEVSGTRALSAKLSPEADIAGELEP